MKCSKKDIQVKDRISSHLMVLLDSNKNLFKECLKQTYSKDLSNLKWVVKQRPNVPFQQQTPKKGLLGKIFGKSNQTPQNLFAPPSGMRKNETRSGGGILDTLKNPEGLNTMLNNTQRVLQAAEQFTPMIQQYGPIVKNLPSIWKLIRAFNSSDTSSDTKKEETEPKTKTKTTAKKHQDFTEPEIEKQATRHTKKERSESVPKLYI